MWKKCGQGKVLWEYSSGVICFESVEKDTGEDSTEEM